MLKKILAITLLIHGVTSLFGQDNSLLWSISGNGLKQTSYLYGTIHMICDSDFEMKEKVTTAFDECKQLYLELDMDNPKEVEIMMESVNGEKKLSEILTEEQQKRLDEKLQKDLGLSLSQLDAYSLTTISTLLTVKGMDCKDIKSYERVFMERAVTNDFEIKGLEKAKFQMQCLNESFDTETAFNNLFDESFTGILDTLVAFYKEENLIRMGEMFAGEGYMKESERDILLVNRNNNWVKKMPKIMKKKATFFAVGSAHLLNEYGLIALLKEKGYTVKPVF